MVNAKVTAIQAKLATVGSIGGLGSRLGEMEKFGASLGKVTSLSNQLSNSLNRMGSIFTGGMGIGLAVGGLAALEKAFERSIQKAKQFQTAQLAIAAQLASSYKITGGVSGKELTGADGFQASQVKAAQLNQEIIQRQARNILTYQEELNAFQSSLASGSRKGLNPEQILNVSEQAAIIAKTMGLAGEQLANAARQLTGGGINVSRTVIGRALGIQNQDIASRNGQELVTFLQSKMKGFQAAEPEFAKSIEGIMSTMEARLDVFFAKVGTKLFAKIQPVIEKLGQALEGGGADKFADTLVSLFNAVFTAIQNIANSPAIPILIKFLEFLGTFGDKLLVIAAFSKLGGVLMGLASNVKGLAAEFQQVALNAAGAGTAMEAAGAKGAVGAAMAGGLSRGPLVEGGVGASGGLPLLPGFMKREGQPLPQDKLFGANNPSRQARMVADMQEKDMEIANANFAAGQAAREEALGGFAMNAAAAGPGEEAPGFLARGKRTLAGLGAIGAQKLPGLALGGLAGYGIGSILSGNFDHSEAGGAAAGATTAATTAIGALAGAGALLNPFGIGIALVTTLLGGMAGALKASQEEERRSTEALKDFNAAHPIAGKLAELSERANSIKNNQYYSPEVKARLLKANGEQQAGLRDVGTANFGFYGTKDPAKVQKDIQANIKQQQQQLSALEGGYIDPKFKLEQEAILAQAKLHLAQATYNPEAGTGGIATTEDQKKRAAAAFSQAERNRAIFSKVAPGQALTPEMAKDLTPGQAEQRIAYEDAQKAIQTKLAEDKKAADLKLAVSREKLSTSKKDIKNDLDTQLMSLEAQMRSERGVLGVGMSNKAWENFITTAKKTLTEDFNEPLKDLEAKISAYDLAGIPKTTGSMVKMAIDAVRMKLKEAGETAGLTAREIASLQAFAVAKQQSEALASQYGEKGSILTATGSKGAGAAAGLIGKEESNRYKYSPEAVQAAGFSSREQMVQAERAQDLKDAQENAKRKQLDLQQAQIAVRQQHISTTLNSGGGVFGEVKAAIQTKVEAQKGFDPAAYERALRESQSLQEQEAEISRQRVKLDLAKAELEYKDSLAAVTALQKGRAGGSTKGGVPGVNAALPDQAGGQGVEAAVASGTKSGGSNGGGNGLTINLNGNIAVPGIDEAALGAFLEKAVPPLIQDFCRTNARRPN